VGEWLLVGGAAVWFPLSVHALRQRWRGNFDERRMVREGVPRPLMTAMSATVAAGPLFGFILLLSTDRSLATQAGVAALTILWPVFIALECSLFIFMFPRFLVPPPIRHRHRQSLASRAFHGPATER
jgi:hypothetical protein